MDTIELVRPEKAHEAQAEAYKQAHLARGERELHGGALLETLRYDEWLEMLECNSSPDTVRPDWVVSSTFFGVRREDERIVGMIDIRHGLNEFLASYGGHIGYGVRPDERGKGYATKMLQLALQYCRAIGLFRVMLACYADNPASRRTIEKCGGRLEREFLYEDGRTVQVFWIELERF